MFSDSIYNKNKLKVKSGTQIGIILTFLGQKMQITKKTNRPLYIFRILKPNIAIFVDMSNTRAKGHL